MQLFPCMSISFFSLLQGVHTNSYLVLYSHLSSKNIYILIIQTFIYHQKELSYKKKFALKTSKKIILNILDVKLGVLIEVNHRYIEQKVILLRTQSKQSKSQMLTGILTICSLMLGIYILMNYLMFNDKPVLEGEAAYHIGCYGSHYPTNHTAILTDKIEQIERKQQESMKLNMYNSITMRDDWEKEVYDVATMFEQYLDQYHHHKLKNEHDLQFFHSLKVAKLQFENCANSVVFNQDQCIAQWEEYQQTAEKFMNIKESLASLIEKKQRDQGMIAASVFDHEEIDEDQVQQLKNQKLKIISADLLILHEKLDQLQIKMQGYIKDAQDLKPQLDRLKQLRNKCPQNKSLIQYCRDISFQVLKIGQEEVKSRQILLNRINNKKVILRTLESLIKKLKKFGTHQEFSEHQEIYDSHSRELALLQDQVNKIMTNEEQLCSLCSEEKIQELDTNITRIKTQLNTKNQLVIDSENQIKEKQREIKSLEESRKEAQHQFEVLINSLFCVDEECKIEQKRKFQEFEQTMNQINKQIIQKQSDIKAIQNILKEKISNLQPFLSIVDSVSECKRKKEYYESLKQYTPMKTGQQGSLENTKNKIIKKLEDFDL